MNQGHIHLFIHCILFIAIYIDETGVPRCAIYIYCNLFIHLHTLQSIHSSTYIVIYSFIYIHCNLFISFIYSIDEKKIFGELTSVCWQLRFPCTRNRAVVAEEEGGLSSVDDSEGDWLERHRWRRRRPTE
jgi:hypothetical protein